MTYDDIIKYFGSRTKTAAALDITEQAVRNWEKNGVPHYWKWAIAWVTKGKLK